MEEVTPPPNELYPLEGGGFKPELDFDAPASHTTAQEHAASNMVVEIVGQERWTISGNRVLAQSLAASATATDAGGAGDSTDAGARGAKMARQSIITPTQRAALERLVREIGAPPDRP